ncbi:MAG: hypothetical protein ACI4QV_04280 [Acutalibacteraceae bacterium]
MIKLYLTVFFIFYLATAFCRYGIGTTHDERMQTQFKLLKLNKPLHFLLFLSFSKKPIAVPCIVSQISNIILLGISFSARLSIPLYLKVNFILLFGLIFIPLFIETVLFNICFNGEWKDESTRACAKFTDAEYSFWLNGKQTVGYLDRYINKTCIFFDEQGKICFSGKYIYNLKKKEFCIFIDGGDTLYLKRIKENVSE